MTGKRPGLVDYPLAETQPDKVRGLRGRSLEDISLEDVMDGTITMEDLRITPSALEAQADIAEAAGRPNLAANFRRASELTSIPQEVIMATYELLRPGRATEKQELLDAASRLREAYGANRIADFIEEAAEVYERRGLYKFRY
jgi:propanediol dehydratase small subunit